MKVYMLKTTITIIMYVLKMVKSVVFIVLKITSMLNAVISRVMMASTMWRHNSVHIWTAGLQTS